jgi:hypothetical protein
MPPRSSTRTLGPHFGCCRIATAAGSTAGATTTSRNVPLFTIAFAVAASSGRLVARMPPNAEVGSPDNASSNARGNVAATAVPQGLPCLTSTQTVSPNSSARANAASASRMLL